MSSPRASARPPHPELLVLGGGAAGFYCALSGAKEGFRTVLVESAELGGTAFRWGCLPAKMTLDGIKAARAVGPGAPTGRGRGSRALRGLLPRVSGSLRQVEARLQRRLEEAGIEVLRGQGAFVGPRTYRVGERALQAEHLVIATGTSPAGLPGVPLDGRTVIGHRQVFAAPSLPRRLLIVGADVEGVELAAMFSALGSRVTLVEQLEELLPGLDRDLAQPVERALRAGGVRFEPGAAVAGAARPAGAAGRRGGLTVELADGRTVECDRMLVTGIRRANIPAGLERTGVSWDPERIRVAPSLATDAPGIYAIGDVNGLLGMAHAAIQQGIALPRSLRAGRPLTGERWRAYSRPPRALYTLPEIGGAGSTERELRQAGIPYTATRVELSDTWRGFSRSSGRGFLKLLTAQTGRVLGIWVSGAEAAEAAALYGLLLDRELGASELAESLVTHPTLAEALREAAFRAGAGAPAQ